MEIAIYLHRIVTPAGGRVRHNAPMDQTPEHGSPGFFERLTRQPADRATRSRQLCRDFYDFCESVHGNTSQLHAAYNKLPFGPDFMLALTSVDRALDHISQNGKDFMPLIDAALRRMDEPGNQGRIAAEMALQENLSAMPIQLDYVASLSAALKQSVNLAKECNMNGPRGEKLTCLQWIAAAEPTIVALDYEVSAMRASLALANGPDTVNTRSESAVGGQRRC